MPQTPMMRMVEAADMIYRDVQSWEPEGMLEVLEAYRHWPDVLHRLSEAWTLMHRKALDEFPLKPVVVELIEAVQRHQHMTAAAAEEIAPTARAVHRDQIDALDNPRNAMWDVRANRDSAAAPVRPAQSGEAGA